MLFQQRFETVEQASLFDGYDVVVCSACGCGFADGIPAQSAFDSYYRDLSKYEYHQRQGGISEYDKARFEAIADLLVPFLGSPQARIVDVGCATGGLLSALKERGFGNVLGLDPSPVCAEVAKRLYDVEVRTTTLSDLAATEDKYDVVVLVGVLEHLRDVGEAVSLLHDVLAPTGRIYVEVPDALAFTDWPNAPFQDFSTEHINFFSPISLENLLREHGFEAVMVEQNARLQSFRTTMSNISAVFHRGAGARRGWSLDQATRPALTNYVRQCQTAEERLHKAVDEIVKSGVPIVVWGVGTHTSRLLATSRLSEAPIVAFVDSNARYSGKLLHGIPILSPHDLRGRPEPILVSSRVFQEEIGRQIREQMGLPNELITLYQLE